MKRGLAFIGVELAVVLLIIAVFALWLLTPVFAAERQCGIASWYGPESGNRTANGERFIPDGLSIAMRVHPQRRALHYRVTYAGKSITVRHNDYGPARSTGRLFDLSRGAATALGLKRHGTGRVCVERVR